MKLTSLLPVILVALCISAPAFAAPKAKSAPAPAPAPAPAYGSGGSSSSTQIQWNVSGPFELLDGTAMFGAYFSGDYFIQHNVSIGGQTGFWIGSSNSVTFWEIPIVATGKYHFDLSSMPNWKPYVGAGIGLGILHAGVATTIAIPGVSTSATEAKFHGEFKIGTAFQSGPGLTAEIRLGVVGSGFLFAPTIGWTF